MTASFVLHLAAVAVMTTALVMTLCKIFDDLAGSDDDPEARDG